MGFLDKWTKKATNTAIETAKEKLSDKYDIYVSFAKISLTLGVLAFGAKHISGGGTPKQMPTEQRQQPIIINNYITDGRYGYGRQEKARQGYQNRR